LTAKPELSEAVTGSRARRFESTEPNILPNYLQGPRRMRAGLVKYRQIGRFFAVFERILRSRVTVIGEFQIAPAFDRGGPPDAVRPNVFTLPARIESMRNRHKI
jgi:hypothetical protein